MGFIVPFLVLLALHLAERRPGAILRLLAPVNLLVFAAIVAPWFFGVSHRHPDFPHYGIVEETFRRYTTSSFHRSGPFYYYAPVLLAVFFPWSVLLPESIAWTARRWRRLLPADRLFVVWAVVVVLFFSTSQSKLPGYVLSSVIALGVLVARIFDFALRSTGRQRGASGRAGGLALAILCAIVSILLGVGLLDPASLKSHLRIRSREFDRLVPVFAPVLASLLVVGGVSS